MSHTCPASGCTATVSDAMLMCRKDWAKVPRPLQRAVYRAYDHGRGLGTEALRHAQDAAIRAAGGKRPPLQPGFSPDELWRQAGGGTDSYDRDRYLDLLREHGHLLSPGDEGYDHAAPDLPCGWPHRGGNTGPS